MGDSLLKKTIWPGSSVRVHKLLKAYSEKYVLWPAAPCTSQAIGWKIYPPLIQSVYLSDFRSSASAAAVPGLQTEPALIVPGATESTTVTFHRSCLPTAHGTSVKPSGRFWSVLWRCRCSLIEGIWMAASFCFTRAFKCECIENLPALLRQDRPCHPTSVTFYPRTHLCFHKLFCCISKLLIWQF